MSNESPTFSVILPTYNRADLLPRAINSVLAQTFSDFELIIVDDASTDETTQVMAGIDDRRVVYIRQEKNCGASAARNAGIDAASGTLVALLDDDDEFYPKFLEKTWQVWQDAPDDLGFTWCGIRRVAFVNGMEDIVAERTWSVEDRNRHVEKSVYLGIGTGYGLTFRADCINKIGKFDESLATAVDVDFLLRLGGAYTYEILPEILVKVHRHKDGQLTDYSIRRAQTLERIIAKHREELYRKAEWWIQFHQDAATIYYTLKEKSQGRRMLWHIIRRAPLRLRSWKSFLYYELPFLRSRKTRHATG